MRKEETSTPYSRVSAHTRGFVHPPLPFTTGPMPGDDFAGTLPHDAAYTVCKTFRNGASVLADIIFIFVGLYLSCFIE